MNNKQKNYSMILFALIASIFITAIDFGIVAPARTTIAASLKATEAQSIWIMTSFSLATASSMLIWSILSDKFGKKKILLINLLFFVISSIFCGLTNQINNYSFMIISRAFQGFFSGGIIPIATSYIATEFPLERKGLAMGLVGATFSIGTIIGPTAGSGLIDWLGHDNWGWLFYINIFFGMIAIPAIIRYVDETTYDKSLKIEVFSITSATATILSLMLFFTNVDFSVNFSTQLQKLDVVIPLVVTLVGSIFTVVLTMWLKGPLYIIKDLFKNKTMALSLICVSIAAIALFSFSIYLPQISETFFKLNSGKGGYYSTIIGAAGIIFGPLCGKLISSWGPKKLLQTFSFVMVIGLVMFLVSLKFEVSVLYFVGLFTLGASQSAVMGLSFNYFIQLDVKKSMQSSAQSMLSLFRSVSGAVGPAITVIFIKSAAKNSKVIASNKGAQLSQIVKQKMQSQMTPQIQHITLDAKSKITSLVANNQATPEKISQIQSQTQTQISQVSSQMQKSLNIPKFNANTCANLNHVNHDFKNIITNICNSTRTEMINGFSNIVMFAIISTIIVFLLTFLFKKFNMKEIMSTHKETN